MADYVRRLVSGDKARFKDEDMHLELDLVYVTDQVIVMGYPAAGIEGFYRNKREDAKKFLERRHGNNFWVFNFCPIKENSYPSSVFGGRVSRYPFPDHHAPPLAIMPLLAREMRAWLSGSSERVAVLHCKAGKGRSGTMACTYLLSLDDSLAAPRSERGNETKLLAERKADELMQAVPEDEEDSAAQDDDATDQTDPKTSHKQSLTSVLELHTSRRMKASSSPNGKVKQGVSIPSQRRWLHYWSLILAHEAPSNLWPAVTPKPPSPKVRLTEMQVRMREPSTMKMGLVKAANIVMGYTSSKNASISKLANGGKRGGQIWASLARYDDGLVDLLERWEVQTRDELSGHMGRRKAGSEHMDEEELSKVFEDGTWDHKKMVRSFARMGTTEEHATTKEGEEKVRGSIMTITPTYREKTTAYTLRPLNSDAWSDLRSGLKPSGGEGVQLDGVNIPSSETNSIYDVTQTLKGDKGIILDAAREVRIKLYMGQVFMGWFWFIPTFHMGEFLGPAKFTLSKKDIDFPLGIGSAILDVEILMEWVSEGEPLQPAARQTSEDALVKGENEPAGLAPMLPLVSEPMAPAVEVKQAAED
ncbi:Telomerase protein component 1 [Pleurotus ostreatus]|uniref:phosphatidylinositol-3,4,5-trisphosphate 3-phosphatase n=1 Tax=Pleurotus ostreatus TaxID=5322 RepID=A0A8H6ZX59_PLEOS|nr:Telomerase protein component 1 [Pleurotus ostreatus]KAF7430287.1 Telomerase protein component 1 [Pleurotus ostreatus]